MKRRPIILCNACGRAIPYTTWIDRYSKRQHTVCTPCAEQVALEGMKERIAKTIEHVNESITRAKMEARGGSCAW